MTRVMTVVGTRPEVIRLARVIPRLDESFEHILVHTGQNYDPTLSAIFFDELKIREPDRHFGVDTTSLATVLAGVLVGTEEAIRHYQPDAVLILGDTNSCLAAVMAKRMRVPVYHMEAGNRCFDPNVPEETNRRLVDHVADFNLVYTEHARRNLLAEGLHPRQIALTGSPMREVLDYYRPAIEGSSALEQLGLASGGYFLVSAHREENVDDPNRLLPLLEALDQLGATYGLEVIVSTHPRTRLRLEEQGVAARNSSVRFHDAMGLLDYCWLQMSARCVLSDSGTISEESLILRFPAVTLRDSIERPEAIDTGGIVMTGVGSDEIVSGVRLTLHQWESGERPEVPAEYLIGNTSQRVVNFIQSTVHELDRWIGRRPFPRNN